MHNKVRTGRTHLPRFTIPLLTHLVNPSERSVVPKLCFPQNSSSINFYQVSKKFFIPKLVTAIFPGRKGWRKTRSNRERYNISSDSGMHMTPIMRGFPAG